MKNYRLLTLVLAGMLCLSVFGCASSSKRVVLDDQTIANQIKDSLEAASGPVAPFTIDIFVEKGAVELDGTVASAAAKAKAIEIAHTSQSVKDVKSFIVVR